GLPVVDEGGGEEVLADRGQVEVGVVEDDRGRLAAELERDRAEQPAAHLGDPPSGGGRAGERDLVDVRVLDQVGADLAAARHDIDHAGREAGGDDRVGEQVRVEHRLGGGLEHDRVAGPQRRG